MPCSVELRPEMMMMMMKELYRLQSSTGWVNSCLVMVQIRRLAIATGVKGTEKLCLLMEWRCMCHRCTEQWNRSRLRYTDPILGTSR